MNELFKSTHDALFFAFNFSAQQYAESQMAKLQKRVIGSGKGLVSLDGAGQAGMILAEVNKLTPLKRHCIIARYAPKTRECPCCGGEKPLDQWRESVIALRDWSLTTFSGLSHNLTREAIILKFYGGRVSMVDVAKRVGVPVKTVYDQRSKIVKELTKLDEAAQTEIFDLLAEKQELIEVA